MFGSERIYVIIFVDWIISSSLAKRNLIELSRFYLRQSSSFDIQINKLRIILLTAFEQILASILHNFKFQKLLQLEPVNVTANSVD